MPHHYAIVGTGIAGLTAAETLRAREPQAAITMIGEEAHNFYSRPGLAYLLRGDIPEKQLYIRNRDDLRALDINRGPGRKRREGRELRGALEELLDRQDVCVFLATQGIGECPR
jgi:NADPH-dependent 2,4-dienoyl-CoA reductase/sulfur reductase-like enzyme